MIAKILNAVAPGAYPTKAMTRRDLPSIVRLDMPQPPRRETEPPREYRPREKQLDDDLIAAQAVIEERERRRKLQIEDAERRAVEAEQDRDRRVMQALNDKDLSDKANEILKEALDAVEAERDLYKHQCVEARAQFKVLGKCVVDIADQINDVLRKFANVAETAPGKQDFEQSRQAVADALGVDNGGPH